MDDNIRIYDLRNGVFRADFAEVKIKPLRFIASPIVLTVHVPSGKLRMYMLCKLMCDGAFVCLYIKQIGIMTIEVAQGTPHSIRDIL